ncbi:hypothetical protein NDU88_003991 [Pleurodeles waltl]|uniref:Secreted protein n=1 Tax=Pleurodeles waltl TaxID=8319 RepID=A0AAV7KWI1_PLEWA|nr:hypothetical protein NDU88_003991 [Pleurodeles waltl]
MACWAPPCASSHLRLPESWFWPRALGLGLPCVGPPLRWAALAVLGWDRGRGGCWAIVAVRAGSGEAWRGLVAWLRPVTSGHCCCGRCRVSLLGAVQHAVRTNAAPDLRSSQLTTSATPAALALLRLRKSARFRHHSCCESLLASVNLG